MKKSTAYLISQKKIYFCNRNLNSFYFFLTHGYQKMNNNVWYFEYK